MTTIDAEAMSIIGSDQAAGLLRLLQLINPLTPTSDVAAKLNAWQIVDRQSF